MLSSNEGVVQADATGNWWESTQDGLVGVLNTYFSLETVREQRKLQDAAAQQEVARSQPAATTQPGADPTVTVAGTSQAGGFPISTPLILLVGAMFTVHAIFGSD